ncbi:MAG TPA: ATP synthase F1 subunit delta [Terriglobia bacterium]|nr:ATP synthase F1 subunit delta [Terriglobia bacterium]
MALANRYARALADVAGETQNYRPTLAELDSFLAVYRESAELREVLDSPAVPELKKLRVLDAILRRLGAGLSASNFLRVLVRNYRMNLLPEMREAFRKVADERLGVVQVRITSATELSEPERQALRARFTELIESQVEMEFSLEQELLGGIRAQVGSTVYDGSVRGELDRIRQQLTSQ